MKKLSYIIRILFIGAINKQHTVLTTKGQPGGGHHVNENGFRHRRSGFNKHAAWNQPGYMGSGIEYSDVFQKIAPPPLIADVAY